MLTLLITAILWCILQAILAGFLGLIWNATVASTFQLPTVGFLTSVGILAMFHLLKLSMPTTLTIKAARERK